MWQHALAQGATRKQWQKGSSPSDRCCAHGRLLVGILEVGAARIDGGIARACASQGALLQGRRVCHVALGQVGIPAGKQ